MTIVKIPQDTANVITPQYPTTKSYSFGYAAELVDYYFLTVPTGSSVIGVVGIQNMPILSMNDLGKIESFNVFIQTQAAGTAGDGWSMYFHPVWLAPAQPLVASSPLLYHMFNVQDDGSLVQDRVHPVTTTTVDTLKYVSNESDGATVIYGGGSHTAHKEPAHIPMVAPYMMIDIVANGATDDFEIEWITIWGARREV